MENIQDNKWSWGGLMLSQILVLASREYVYLLLYLVFFVPVLNIIGIIAIPIYFGLKGRQLVLKSKGFDNHQEAIGFMKGVDHAGKIMFMIGLVVLAVMLIGGLFVGGLFLSLFGHSMFNPGNWHGRI